MCMRMNMRREREAGGMHVHTCICMCTCMYVCMYVCMWHMLGGGGGGGVPCELAVDGGTPRDGMLLALEHEHARTLTHYKTGAVGVEGLAGGLRAVV